MLKSTNLSANHKKLIKATIPELKYDLMKDQLNLFLTEDFSQITIEQEFNSEQECNPFRLTNSQETCDQELDTYYSRGNYHNYNSRSNISRHYQQQPKVRSQNNMRQMQQTQQRKNPCNRNSIQLRCHICKSIYHMAQNCQEKYDTLYTQEVVLYQSDFDHPEQLKTLVSETGNLAVLDSGTTNTVAGEVWYNCFITSLNENEKQKIEHHIPRNTYRFRDGKLFPALQNVDIPISLEAAMLC